MSKQQIGVIGMAVMGRNLAMNLESRGYTVSIFNRSCEKTNEIIAQHPFKHLVPFFSLKDFVKSLEKPRCIFLMVQAGKSTDDIINSLMYDLEKGDILIDGGNAFYKDTIRRCEYLTKHGIQFIGAGISGGEEGALKGPAIMPSGHKEAYLIVAPILKKIAAYFKDEPCVNYIGPNGSGHYVKMVHNGIEYGDMQLISEAYFLLNKLLKLNNEEIANVFKQWNKGELNSYLIEITQNIFHKIDDKGNYLIDFILDEASNKGTGQWTSQSALELGEPLSIITSSVFARYLSVLKSQRLKASNVLSGPLVKVFNKNTNLFIDKIGQALYLSKIICYTQGFSQLKKASDKNHWNINYSSIAKIFRAGCIIRAKLLQKISHAYEQNPKLVNLLLDKSFQNIANDYQQELRDVVTYAIQNGLAIPAFSAAIAYYDSYRSPTLPANLIQAQRDYFGAHCYKRIDTPGMFHTEWND
ncbi:NADP-dependent phosphogluconate dehydrogenase [Candidatus Ishikawella capsulata]|uniref:6-phosphogluconate dehydrogenase, decarboxylating n=1 Tax=Candidatus Ishikawaella capsulata Mpkobe TaxID=476281 RepID=C5WDB5_9ENTR|nr:NADP-dependent phosphogluconate dehydrogenase [Candidatus Ishikawaella capsulata]BAH83321.1 6-phosphogluconate dehydrogenase [Candidatus Ishikawaella capsulata Mpkobe]